MNALAVVRSQKVARVNETREGVIDLFSGTWLCSEHNTTMKVGRECAFCAVETHGDEILDSLAF